MASETKFKETEIGMIPEEWNLCKFEDLFEVPLRNGLTRPKKVRGSGIKMVNMGELFSCDRIFSGMEMDKVPISDDEFEKFKLKKGDLLFARQSLVLEGAGKCSIIIEDTIPSTFESHIIRCRLNKKLVDPLFYFYFYNSIIGRNLVSSIVEQVAAAGIRGSDLSKLSVLYPSKEEQKRIADIFSTLDDKIDLNNQMNKTLEQIAQTLFKHWFIDLEFPDENGNPYRSSGGRMVDSELGEIPEGWEVKKVDETLELAYGKALKEEIRVPGNIPVYGSNGQVGWHNEKLVDGPGIVVGRKGNPGTVTFVHTDFYPIDTTFYVVPKGPVKSFYYLLYALKKQDLPSLAADSAVPGLNRNMVYMNKIIIPQRDTLSLFDLHLNNLYQKIQMNEEQSTVLASIRDSLLPKLMSGKIRVEC